MQRQQSSLKAILLKRLLFVSTFPLVVVALFAYFYIAQEITTDIGLKNGTLAQLFAEEVELILSRQAAMLNQYVHFVESGVSSENCDYLFSETPFKSIIYFESVYRLNTQGKVTDICFAPDTGRIRDDYLAIDLSQHSFFQKALAVQQPVWSESFLSIISGKLALTLIIPRNDFFYAANINIDNLYDLTRDKINPDHLVFAIIDNDGGIIFHPEKSLVESHSHLFPASFDFSQAISLPKPTTFSFDNKEYHASFGDIADTGWHTVIIQPAADAIGPLRILAAFIFGLLFGLAFLATLTSWVLARRLAEPLVILSETAIRTDLQGFDLSAVKKAPYREASVLSKSLENMATTLAKREMALLEVQNNLEHLVQERTLELLQNQQKFQNLVENSHDWIWEVDETGAFTYSSPMIESILGYEPNEIIGQKLFNLMPDEAAEALRANFAKVSCKKLPLVAAEKICLHKGGHLVFLESRGVPVCNASGKLTHYRGIDRNVTERTIADRKLKESERKYKQLVEDLGPSSFLFQTDPDGRVTYISPSVGGILGISPKQIVGQQLQSLFHQDQGKGHMPDTTSETDNHQNYQELAFEYTDGTMKFFALNSHQVYTDEGVIAHIEGLATDITDKKVAEMDQKLLNDLLEQKIHERTEELEKLNTTLKVLLEKRDEDRLELGQNVISNYEITILPFLDKLKSSLRREDHLEVLSMLESNLRTLISPFAKELATPIRNLTPTEIQIASLIKQGKSTKEIAQALHISVRTVTNHRNNIRKKLGIINQKTNLQSYLQTL